ncbi:hypothetical protein DESC_780002 [Desulfosarcina cetonica]|nr:hypothetical protein DESC_780002 [Desulfosarcina cetonica]
MTDSSPLVFPRRPIDLIQGKHGTVLADQFLADAAAAAHAEAAFHAVFKAHDDMIMVVAQFLQHRLGEFDHDRRAADNRVGVVAPLGGLLFGDRRHEPHIVLPVRIVGAVHGDVHVDVVTLFPFHQLVLVEQHAR